MRQLTGSEFMLSERLDCASGSSNSLARAGGGGSYCQPLGPALRAEDEG